MKYRRYSDPITRTRRWKSLRWQALKRDGFRCVQCSGRGRLEVDHIKPVRDAPELAWSLDNLQSLCPTCHGRKTRLEAGHPDLSEDRKAWQALLRHPILKG